MTDSPDAGRPLGQASGGEQGFWDRLGVGDDLLPVHLPMGVTERGEGPENHSAAYAYVCWCGDAECRLTLALGHAWASGRRIGAERALRAAAPRPSPDLMSDGEGDAWDALHDDSDIICTCDGCNYYSPTYDRDRECSLNRHIEGIVAARLTDRADRIAQGEA